MASYTNKEKFNMSTDTDSSVFGDITNYILNAGFCGNQTISMYGGYQSSYYYESNELNYLYYASSNCFSSFGSLEMGVQKIGALSNQITALFAGGIIWYGEGEADSIQRILFASLSDATNFGSLLGSRFSLKGTSDDEDIGLFVSGMSYFADRSSYTIKQKVALASENDAVDWGDLSVTRSIAAVSEGM